VKYIFDYKLTKKPKVFMYVYDGVI
jgi:hypothetical protein